MNALAQLFMIHLNVLCSDIVQSAIITVYEPRRRCPNTEEKWRERKEGYICPSPTQYHCMLKGDGGIVEFCSDIIWIEDDYCPVFNTKTGSIDVQLCPENGYCPREQYLSNTVYKYPDCLHSRTTSESNDGGISMKRKGSSEEPPVSKNVIAMDALRLSSISVMLMAINLFLLTVIFIVLIYRYLHIRNDKEDVSKPKSEEDGSTKAGTDLEISGTHS